MAIASYAALDPTRTFVVSIEQVDSNVVAMWQSTSNPKFAAYLPVTMTAKPGFNAATQEVVQNGWTVNPGVDVEPVWVVQSLSAARQAIVQGEANMNTVLASGIITRCNSYIALSNPTLLQSQAAVLDLVKFVKAFVQKQFAVNT